MKLSLKIRDEQHHQSPLLRSKIPIKILGLPFLSGVAVGDSSDLSFSLQTHLPSGPSLKLSYTPSAPAVTTTAAPLCLSLKSGVGPFGSPYNSPLTLSAHLSLSANLSTQHPTFSLHLKPNFGSFSLCKKTLSSPNQSPKQNSNPNLEEISADGFVPLVLNSSPGLEKSVGVLSNGGSGIGFFPEKPLAWRGLRVESCGGKDGILSGFAVRARTALPVLKGVVMNVRWGVNFPAEFGKSMPFLTVDKIGIERIQEAREVVVKRNEGNVGDVELLRSMCVWMSRDLEALRTENTAMKRSLEELRLGVPVRVCGGDGDGIGKKKSLPSLNENPGEFEQWRSRRKGEDNVRKEHNRSENRASDVESELQRAIKAASS